MLFRKLTLSAVLTIVIALTTIVVSPHNHSYAVECKQELNDFQVKWFEMTDAEQEKVNEKALWMARVMMSEDKRDEPWLMIASIVVNRQETKYRGRTTVYGVIHDPYQFSAVNTSKWTRYKNLNPDNGNELFDRAYELAKRVIVLGVPEKYEGVTHAYYPETMAKVYGYSKDYPVWDTPERPMNNRDEVEGWIYGQTL